MRERAARCRDIPRARGAPLTFFLGGPIRTGPRALHLQADFANLRHLQDELELAIAEMKQPQSQRFARYIR